MPRRYLAAILLLVLSASAQTNTAEQLYNRGMDALSGSGPSRNDLEAIDYFKRSAEIGYLPAQVALGSFYDREHCCPGSDSQAAEWYRKAAEKGDPLAQWLLGRVYFNGNGIPQDFAPQRNGCNSPPTKAIPSDSTFSAAFTATATTPKRLRSS